jgi:hypothetical protein
MVLSIMHGSVVDIVISGVLMIMLISCSIGIVRDGVNVKPDTLEHSRYMVKKQIRGGKIGETILHFFLMRFVNEDDPVRSSRKLNTYIKVLHICMKPLSVDEVRTIAETEATK